VPFSHLKERASSVSKTFKFLKLIECANVSCKRSKRQITCRLLSGSIRRRKAWVPRPQRAINVTLPSSNVKMIKLLSSTIIRKL
jgi:hypothetical protein